MSTGLIALTIKDLSCVICYAFSPKYLFHTFLKFRDSLMAGLIVAGYDAVHKQGQVKHPSLDYK